MNAIIDNNVTTVLTDDQLADINVELAGKVANGMSKKEFDELAELHDALCFWLDIEPLAWSSSWTSTGEIRHARILRG
jgi:hypothetical protein